MTWLLRPGLRPARRGDGHLQVGLDERSVRLPDAVPVRRLLKELAHGAPLTTLDAATAPALDALVRAGLVVTADAEATRATRRERAAVHLDLPDDLAPAGRESAQTAGLGLAGEREAAGAALVWAVGEVPRGRVDGWVRSATPHLVVRETPDGPVLGPHVAPGATACLRCVDAHLGERDPRRALVVEQLAHERPWRPAAPDPLLRALALAWAVHDLATAAEGEVPTTWSATVALGALPPERTAYRRHPHCGCSWGDGLAEPVAAAG